EPRSYLAVIWSRGQYGQSRRRPMQRTVWRDRAGTQEFQRSVVGVDTEQCVEPWMQEVGIHRNDRLTALREGNGQVRHGCRLAVTFLRTRNQDALAPRYRSIVQRRG